MQKHFFIFFVLGLVSSCESQGTKKFVWQSKEVTATAYNSLAYQTSEKPSITAFGDTLKPGMKCIAVSRDLLALGLEHNTLVVIEGFDGVYLVKDKMHYRWKNRIDIYMDDDVKTAKEWGRKKLTINYRLEVDEDFE